MTDTPVDEPVDDVDNAPELAEVRGVIDQLEEWRVAQNDVLLRLQLQVSLARHMGSQETFDLVASQPLLEPDNPARVTNAIHLAVQWHRGQWDAGRPGVPYVCHPLRVMSRFDDPSHQLVAVLHDVGEDCVDGDEEREAWWAMLTEMGATRDEVTALQALCHRPGEPLRTYWERVSTSALALAVKDADVDDNDSAERRALLPGDVAARLEAKYADYRAWRATVPG